MIINHNIAALNTYRQLSTNSTSTQNSLAKLSSGLRINKAGDDAAGLAISEKMRAQIRGLDQATRNAQDGISLIQTAEGALNETHSILQRMRELAVQSATDTNIADDRSKIQAEIDQLAKEITRIANTTEFNKQNLLNGGKDSSVSNATGALRFHIGSNEGQYVDLAISAMDAQSLGVADTNIKALDTNNGIKAASFSGDRGDALVDGASIQITSAVGTAGATGAAAATWGLTVSTTTNTDELNGITLTFVSKDGIAAPTAVYDANSKTMTVTLDADDSTTAGQSAIADVATAINDALDNAGFTADIAIAGASITDTADGTTASVAIAGGAWDTMTLTITDTVNTETADVKANVESLTFAGTHFKGINVQFDQPITTSTATTLVINDSTATTFNSDGSVKEAATTAKGIDVSTQKAADLAITKINQAIEKVSAERSNLGAMQNRLEHTINNLGTSSENLTAAESRIRDVDMAKEMMNFTKNNILNQAAQAMLAQANQQPQGVLQLLR